MKRFISGEGFMGEMAHPSSLDILSDIEDVTERDIAIFCEQRVLAKNRKIFLALSETSQRTLVAIDRLDHRIVADILLRREYLLGLHELKNQFCVLALLTNDAKYLIRASYQSQT